MSEHLRPEDFVDALDGAPSASAQAHIDACAICQAELANLQSVVSDAERVEAPAPSPLFWEHFSERVRLATAAENVPGAAAWWHAWWRPAGMLAAAAGAIALVIALRPAAPSPDGAVAGTASPVQSLEVADDGSWGLVMGLASELAWTDVKEAAEPRAGTVDAVIEELTPSQREALVRLLQKEMGEP